jgi:translation elongation factor EF-G
MAFRDGFMKAKPVLLEPIETLKVNSGVLKTDDLIYNIEKDVEEQIGRLYVLQGN